MTEDPISARTARTTATAIVVAVAQAQDGPAAALGLGGGTVLARLLEQLAGLGVSELHVITRPGWETAIAGGPVVHACADAAADLRAIAEIAREGAGGLVLVQGDVVTHREALAGLLADPRISDGVLVAAGQRPLAPQARVRGGVVASAGSAFHQVGGPNAAFLGVLKLDAGSREVLAGTAERLAPFAATHAIGDALSLLVVGLVRGDVALRTAGLRGLAWARPATPQAAGEAATALALVDEDRVRLDSAVKPVDGFFTTFFVSPYSRHLARWAAGRGLTPNQVTTASLALGFLSAACFATGERWGLVAGAILLQVAFATDCVDGQLARYSRQFSELGAWLDSTFDRAKEWLVFAGLGIGAARAGDPVWVLAGAALTLQTVRHMVDFCWQRALRRPARRGTQPPIEEPGDGCSDGDATPEPAGSLGRWGDLDAIAGVVWIKRLIAFPIGERFALISVTAAFWTARTTFTAWLAWGGLAAVYGIAGRILRSLRLRPSAVPMPELVLYRDDGPLTRLLGAPGRRLPALALVLAGLLPLLAVIAIEGDGAADATAVAVVAWFVLVAGLSGGRTGTSRIRWMVPPLLRAGEYAGLLWIGTLAGAASIPAAFALLAALALRQYDIVYGLRYRGAPVSERLGVLVGGWDGRLALACVLLIAGALPAGFYVLAAIIAVVFCAAAIHDWSRARMPVTFHDELEDEDA